MITVEDFSDSEFVDVKIDVYDNKCSQKDKQDKHGSTKHIGIFNLFRYADKLEIFLMIFGQVNAVICGSIYSLTFMLFGSITEVLTRYQPNGEADRDNNHFMVGVIKYAYQISLVGLGILLTHYFFVSALNYSAERQILRIRKLFLAAVLRQDVAWFDTTATADFSSMMTEDLNKMQEGMGEKLGMILRFISTGLTAFIYPFLQNWLLSLVLLSLVPILIIMGVVLGRIMTTVTRDEIDNYGAAGAVAEDVLSAMRTVMAYGGQEKELKRYSAELNSARKNTFIRGTLTATAMGLVFGLIYGTYSFGLWYGINIMLDDKESEEFNECSFTCFKRGENPMAEERIADCVTNCFRFNPGSTVSCVFGILHAGVGIGQSVSYIESLNLAMSAAEKVFEVINRKPLIDSNGDQGAKPDKFLGHIKFQDVSFSYPSRADIKVLNKFNLEIPQGKTVALVGPSGCGKSTCIQLLQRFYDPDSGIILIDGRNLKDLNVGWVRDQIGIVAQEPVLFDCSIRDNLCLANLGASENEIKKACQEANAFQFIENLPEKLNTVVGEGGVQLSGGQKQRVAVARALVRNPKLLLLDEATSALDTHSEAIFQDTLGKTNGCRTTIIVAHRLSTIENTDIIVALENGKVKEKGTHKDLMKLKGLYFSLVERQIAYNKEDVDNIKMDPIFKPPFRNPSKQVSSPAEQNYIVTTIKSHQESKIPTSLYMRIISFNIQEAPFIVFGLIGALMFGASTPLFGVIVGDMVSILSEEDIDQGRQDLTVFALQLGGLGLAFFLVISLQGLMFSYSGSKLVERLRRKLFEAMLMQDLAWFDEESNNTGALCARLSSSAEAVSSGTGAKVGQVVGGSSMLIFSTSLAIYYNWRLGLATSCFLPPLILSMVYQMRLTGREEMFRKEALENSGKIAMEAINNIRTVAGLRCENKMMEKYASALEKPFKNSKNNVHLRGFVFGFANSFIYFSYGLCFYYGAWLLINVPGSMESPFIILKVAMVVLGGGTMLGMSFSCLIDMQSLFQAAETIFNIIDREPRININDGVATTLEGNMSMQDAQFFYPTRPDTLVLNKLCLSMRRGERIALVGQSGCGKSTVVQLIQRLYDLDQGYLSLECQDIKHLNIPCIRNQIAIVSQEPVLFSRSINDNIKYGDNTREVSEEEVIAAAKKAKIHNFVSQLPEGYATHVGGRGKQLSGGQKQRVAIARALIRNPSILLLDEATSALDSESEKTVQDALETALEGRTSITIAHRLSTIRDADNIYVIDQGSIVEGGTHPQLMNRGGIYSKMWNRSSCS